jgi:hypothetical protein
MFYCARWGYIVAFAKVLTIYHTLIHPFQYVLMMAISFFKKQPYKDTIELVMKSFLQLVEWLKWYSACLASVRS